MKVIFLDIDGVLNSQRTCLAMGGIPSGMKKNAVKFLDPLAISMIRETCKLADAKIVLSSTWRKCRDFKEYAKEFNLPIIDRTASHSNKGSLRGYEIEDWLENHVEVTHYAIIDDDSDMLDYQKKYFVHVNGLEGFLYSHAVRLGEILEVNPWNRPRAKIQ